MSFDVPAEIERYHEFHAAFNDFTWLLKARWSSREDLIRRRFRAEVMLQRFIAAAGEPPQVRRLVLGPKGSANEERAILRLKKAWYDELAFGTPAVPDALLLDAKGVNRNIAESSERMIFLSWRVTQAYYATYNVVHALLQLRGCQYQEENHQSAHRTFKANMLAPLSESLFAFPLGLAGVKGEASAWTLAEQLPDEGHLRFKYAAHPRSTGGWRRPSGDGFEAVARRLLGDFRRRAQTTGPSPFLVGDLLSDFREWGNYIDVENLLGLFSPAFRAYLDQDLHLVVFFHVAIAELAAIAVLGAPTVTKAALEFHRGFVQKNPSLWRPDRRRLIDVRFRVYEHVGWLGSKRWRPSTAPLPFSEMTLV